MPSYLIVLCVLYALNKKSGNLMCAISYDLLLYDVIVIYNVVDDAEISE